MEQQEASTILASAEVPTPPLIPGSKRGLSDGAGTSNHRRDGSEPINPDSLSKALQEYKETGQGREKTPTGSPSRKRQRVYGDR